MDYASPFLKGGCIAHSRQVARADKGERYHVAVVVAL